jgi:hypothetical protein
MAERPKLPSVSSFAGCLIGQCLGDALGFIVEGSGPDECQAYVENLKQPCNLAHYRRGHYGFGQYSDDSQLARELMLSLGECGKLDPADYAVRISRLFAENLIVGRGLATDEAAKRLARGVSWETAGVPPPAAGNGTAMRAAPIGLFFATRKAELVRAAHDQSRITHLDRRCSAGSVAIAGAVAIASRHQKFDVTQFAQELSAMADPFDRVLSSALLQLPLWVTYAPFEVVSEISGVGRDPTFREPLALDFAVCYSQRAVERVFILASSKQLHGRGGLLDHGRRRCGHDRRYDRCNQWSASGDRRPAR